MKSKTSIIFSIMVAIFLIACPQIQGKSITKKYSILKDAVLTLQFPDTFQEKVFLSEKDIPPKILYYTKDSKIYITFHWNTTQLSNVTANEIAIARIKMLGEKLLGNAVETKLSIQRADGKKSFIVYFILTDKDPKKGFKYLTHGCTAMGNFILEATIFTDSKDHPSINQGLQIIGSGDFEITKK